MSEFLTSLSVEEHGLLGSKVSKAGLPLDNLDPNGAQHLMMSTIK